LAHFRKDWPKRGQKYKNIQSFVTFIVVVVPFVMLFYGGLTILVYDQMMTASGSLAVVALAQTGNPSMRQNNHQ
jgi:hypothetical protein